MYYLSPVDKECTEFRCRVLCLFLVEACKRRVLKYRRRLCLLHAASMSPFSATSFVGRCVANLALSTTIAAHRKHPVRFVLPVIYLVPRNILFPHPHV